MFLIRNITNINDKEIVRISVELIGIPDYTVFEREIISTFSPTKYS